MSLFDGKAGETVIVEAGETTGTDSHGNPVHTTSEIPVGYVLVSPGRRSDLKESTDLDGVLVAYTLHFPKTCDLKLKGCRVNVRGDWYRVVGSPDHYDRDLTPGHWSMTVEVEAVSG